MTEEFSYQNSQLMNQLGKVVHDDKDAFIDLLEVSGVPVESTDDTKLIDIYVENISENDDLKVCSAYLLTEKMFGIDGVTNREVCRRYDVLNNHWEGFSNFGWGEVVNKAVDFGKKAYEGQQQKKTSATDMAQKKAEAKTEMIKSLLAQKQAKEEKEKANIEAKQKTKKAWIIGGSIVGGLAVIGLIVYLVKRNK
jgi:hypothetical protein